VSLHRTIGGTAAREAMLQQRRWCPDHHLTVRRQYSTGTLNKADLTKSVVSYAYGCCCRCLSNYRIFYSSAVYTTNPPFARVNSCTRTINATLSAQKSDRSVFVTARSVLGAVHTAVQSTMAFQSPRYYAVPSSSAFFVYEASLYWYLLYPAKSIHQAMQTK
jgi:hypothetical protein